jgi:hypothetical protein
VGETFLHKSGEVRNVDWIFFQWGTGLAVTGRTRDIGQKFYNLLFKQEIQAVAAQLHFFLSALIDETTIRNIIIMLYNNYIIIMCINNNNAVINYNLWKTPRPYFALKFPMSTRKNVFQVYGVFGCVPSESFVCPGIG